MIRWTEDDLKEMVSRGFKYNMAIIKVLYELNGGVKTSRAKNFLIRESEKVCSITLFLAYLHDREKGEVVRVLGEW